MSREYRDLLAKAGAAGDEELEQKARGLMPRGGSGRMWMHTAKRRVSLAGGDPTGAKLKGKKRTRFARLQNAGQYLAARANGVMTRLGGTPTMRRGYYNRNY